jgi:uncharacterized repeat protein (TIGR01451 family)
VSAGAFAFQCAVVNGGVKCSGLNNYGQLGNGNAENFGVPPTQTIPENSGATALDSGTYNTCVVVSGGLKCWGDGVFGTGKLPADKISAGAGISQVSLTPSYYAACALVNGGVACYGGNNNWPVTGNGATPGRKVAVVPESNLSISQAHSPSVASAGKDVVITLTVANAGPATASGVTVTNAIPAGTTYVWTSPTCSHAAGAVTCNFATMASGTSTAVRVVVRPAAAGSFTNVATITATQPEDPNTANNTTSSTINVNATPAGVPVLRYRLYSPVSKEHHFTTDLNEYNQLGASGQWQQEGTVGQVLNNPGSYNGVEATPYYRLYNVIRRWHHWTTDPNEYYWLGQYGFGWNSEGVDGYLLPTQAPGTIPLYRLVYPAIGDLHHWTIDENEYTTLISTYGWVGEGGTGFVIP